MRESLFEEGEEEYGAECDCHDGAEKINRSVPHYPQLTAYNRSYVMPKPHNYLFLKEFSVFDDS